MKIEENHHHIDHDNQHTFEIEDLKKLILKTSADLTEADRRRREDFKEYELQKEFEKQEKLQALDEEHRKQYEKELKEKQEKHDKHEKVHHPGNKAQLEEVWEKQDHMDPQDFNPQTFFMMHDLDGNNFWDENEVKALFVKELDKLYTPGMPEDDMRVIICHSFISNRNFLNVSLNRNELRKWKECENKFSNQLILIMTTYLVMKNLSSKQNAMNTKKILTGKPLTISLNLLTKSIWNSKGGDMKKFNDWLLRERYDYRIN